MDASTDTPGKVLIDKKRAQGHGPPFHCEFTECTDEGENNTKYCRQHRCQWAPPGATGPCERVRAEAAFGRGLFAYCLAHKCRRLGCRSARQGEMPFCAGHLCQMPGCRQGYEQRPLAAGSALYCEKHKCLNFGCPRARKRHTERAPAAGGPEVEAGGAERTFFGYFCSEHECRETGCYVGVVPPDATFGYGMGYCSYHLLRFLPPPEARKKKRYGCFRS